MPSLKQIQIQVPPDKKEPRKLDQQAFHDLGIHRGSHKWSLLPEAFNAEPGYEIYNLPKTNILNLLQNELLEKFVYNMPLDQIEDTATHAAEIMELDEAGLKEAVKRNFGYDEEDYEDAFGDYTTAFLELSVIKLARLAKSQGFAKISNDIFDAIKRYQGRSLQRAGEDPDLLPHPGRPKNRQEKPFSPDEKPPETPGRTKQWNLRDDRLRRKREDFEERLKAYEDSIKEREQK